MLRRIENVHILCMDEEYHEYHDSSLTFDDDIIVAINDDSLKVDEVIDGKKGILLPGMINAHSHLGMMPFRSLGDDCKDRLRRFLFPLEKRAMTKELVYTSSLYSIAEMLLGGVTNVFDMYYFEEVVAEAVKEMGIRATLAETILNDVTPDSDKPYGGIEYVKAFIQKWKDKDPLIAVALGPHATNTLSKEKLLEIRDLAKELGVKISMHVSEMDYEMTYFKDTYNMSPIEFLESIDMLSDDLLCVHVIHTSDHDLELLQKYDVPVAFCPGSNTKAGKGVARVYEMLQKGIKVALGTDGPSSGNRLDVITLLGIVPRTQKTYYHDRSILSAKETLSLATLKGAKALKQDHQIGSLEVGKLADMVLIETDSVNMFPIHDYYSAIVYSALPSNVSRVWVNGKELVKDGKLVYHDLSKLKEGLLMAMHDFNKIAKELSEDIA